MAKTFTHIDCLWHFGMENPEELNLLWIIQDSLENQ